MGRVRVVRERATLIPFRKVVLGIWDKTSSVCHFTLLPIPLSRTAGNRCLGRILIVPGLAALIPRY